MELSLIDFELVYKFIIFALGVFILYILLNTL